MRKRRNGIAGTAGPGVRIFPIAAALVFVGVIAMAPSSAAPTFTAGVPDTDVRVYLRAASTTNGPFLSLDPASPSANVYYLSQDLAGGAVQVAKAVAWQSPDPLVGEFHLSPGLPETCYLNLTRPVVLSVFPNGVLHSLHYSAELFQGGVLIAAKEWISDVVSSAISNEGYLAHAEHRLVQKDQPITLRITRWTGLGQFGVELAPTLSMLRLPCVPYDPLAGGLYVENGVMTASNTGPTGEASTSEDADPSMAGTGMLVPFLGATRWRRRWTLGVTMLLACGGVAGCVGPSGEAPTQVGDGSPRESGVERNYQGNETLSEKGLGSIQGTVRDGKRAAVAPLPDVHITILGTSLFTTTDGVGRYGFVGLLERAYILKFDRLGYASAQVPAEVKAGQILHLNVTLEEPGSDAGNATSGLNPHTHPEWLPGETRRLVQDVTFPLNQGPAHEAGQVQEKWYCLHVGLNTGRGGCEAHAPIDTSKRIPPGTNDVEVILSWPRSDVTAPSALAIRFDNAARNRTFFPNEGLFPTTFMSRGPDRSFHIAIFPHEADPGHQVYTDWQFWVMVPEQWLYRIFVPPSPTGPILHLAQDVRMQVFAHKGIEPLEPGHKDLWMGKDTVRLVDGVIQPKAPIHLTNYPEQGPVWTPGIDAFVGTGRSRLYAWLNVSGSSLAGLPDASGTRWRLLCLPGNKPLWSPWSDWVSPKLEAENGLSSEYSLDVDPSQADQYYFAQSHWRFAVDDGVHPTWVGGNPVSVNSAYAISGFNLTVVVHRLS